MRKVVNISLPENLKKKVDEEMKKGHYASRSEFFRDILRERIKKNNSILTLEEIKEKALPIFKEEEIKKASIFGSAVRGEMTLDSDIDFLVEMPEGASLFDLAGLKNKLEDILGRKVDISTYKSVKKDFKENIMKEQVKIYG